MGYERVTDDCLYNQQTGHRIGVAPHYSTEISDSWEVIQSLRAQGFSYCLEQTSDSEYPTAWFLHSHHRGILPVSQIQERYSATGPIEYAICVAALKAVENVAEDGIEPPVSSL